MTPVKVHFKSSIYNPDYRYGDVTQSSRIPIEGIGRLINIQIIGGIPYGIVISQNDNKFYQSHLDELLRIIE